MGFFGGKKKDKEKDADVGTEQAQRKSRRIVAPGAGKGAAPAAAPGKNETRSAQVRSGTPRPPSKPLPGTDSGRMQEPRAPQMASPSRQAQATPLPQIDEDIPNLISAPPRPKSREPIIVGQSRPPEFAGGLNNLAARKGGPCRTGDEALLDFLQNKASLLGDDQVAQVRSKADQDSLPIDVAAVQLGFITEEQMVNALTQECWVPHLKVDKYEIRKKALDTVARDDAMHFGVFPVDKLGSLLTLAMVNPLDAETIRVLENKTSLDIKKVVATRTEITQGIEKYYSGQVQAKDGALGFTQDIEPKSVTQMMSKVAPAPTPAPTPPSRPMTAMHAPPPADNIVPEIQDIDDLLSSDEAIAPAIIEPISLKADAEIVPVEPVLSDPEPVLQMEAVEPEPRLAPPAPRKAPSAEFTIDEATAAPEVSEPVLTRKQVAPAPAAKTPSLAPEFEMEDSPPVAPPKRAPAPPAPSPTPARPAVPPVARPPEPARPPTAPVARSTDPASRPATSRFSGTGRTEKSGVVNLIPVMEEEFQHAITHGKSHVFEKWVGLQSRNRIINAVVVEADFDRLLGGLYAHPRRI